ncbi:META domain-containing protein [Aquicoccus sp.]|uniref:META domain-containing protein n=1 Tax=Aquicoccus sp. TaxID=2055851 RepID=UPI00356544DA
MLRSFAAILATCLALPLDAQEATRDITGSLTYLTRIALPPDAEVSVAARGAFDTVLGEARFDTDRNQVPLPFSLTVPDGLSGHVEALINVGGAPRWFIRDIAFDAGDAPVDLGELELAPITPLAFATKYDCNGQRVTFGILSDRAVLRVDGRDFAMQEAVSASGTRYAASDGSETEFWSQGDAAMLTLEGQDMGQCVKAMPEPPLYRAGGNEPGWHVRIGADTVDLTADYGALSLTAPRPDVQVAPGAYFFDMPQLDARLTVKERLCYDAATGMPYPHTATLMLEDRNLKGCGGNPDNLLTGAEWHIDVIAGQGVIGDTQITIAFGPDMRISGHTGCNRFMGGYKLTGEGLRLGQLGVTMMACPEAQMAQERRVLDALDEVRRFDIEASGRLLLVGDAEDGPLMAAHRP